MPSIRYVLGHSMNFGTCIRRSKRLVLVVLYLLGVSLWFPAYGDDKSVGFKPSPQGETVPFSLDPEIVANAKIVDIPISEDSFRKPLDWDEVSGAVLRDLPSLQAGLSPEFTRFREQSSADDLRSAIETNKIKFNLGGIGRAEYNSVDGNYFTRVVHEKTGLSLLLLDADVIDPKSEHLRQIIARQHIDAGDAEGNGVKRGRDVVVVWERGGVIQSTDYQPRSIPGSPEWWADYYYATYKTPKKGDIVLGCMCTALQMASASCVSGMKILMDPTQSFDWASLGVTSVFSMTIGTFATTYRNWTWRGSDIGIIAKLSLVSLAYGYSLMFFREGTATIFRLDDPQAWLMHAHLFLNAGLNNLGRTAWQRLPQIRESMRKNTGTFDISIFGKKIGEGISRASFQNQMIYLVPFTLKLIGLVGLGVKVTVPGTDWGVDSGTLLLLGSIPLAHYLVLKMAERNHYPKTDEVRKQFHEILKFPFVFPKTIAVKLVRSVKEVREELYPIAKETVKSLGRGARNSCQSLFRKLTAASDEV